MQNTELSTFINTFARPAAEDIRAIKTILSDTVARFKAGPKTVLDAGLSGEELIDDGRADEGLPEMTVQNTKELGVLFTDLQNVLDAPGVDTLLATFCVRPRRGR